ncbi:type II toxin-antitoxin system VapC family toxin [Algoriphagus aquimarinus]|mgnify:CR=1 FL=1|uniref:type II toxin-antitoxin system VapC family toxin n=1 Tax=Algoriphagus aquimarinus TaxID=237018 RepID=UPI0030DD05C4|tara:strand:- start:55 stop:384 length:330 start_codon:yes stop_codon:yes gene_type:complete
MEKEIILLDTGILIEYFRKKDKEKSILYQLSLDNYEFKVASITQYEVLLGSNDSQINFWKELFGRVKILPFDEQSAITASKIYKQLKTQDSRLKTQDLSAVAEPITNIQ